MNFDLLIFMHRHKINEIWDKILLTSLVDVQWYHTYNAALKIEFLKFYF